MGTSTVRVALVGGRHRELFSFVVHSEFLCRKSQSGKLTEIFSELFESPQELISADLYTDNSTRSNDLATTGGFGFEDETPTFNAREHRDSLDGVSDDRPVKMVEVDTKPGCDDTLWEATCQGVHRGFLHQLK